MQSSYEAREKALATHSVYHFINSKVSDAITKGKFEVIIVNIENKFDCFVDPEDHSLNDFGISCINHFTSNGYYAHFDRYNKFLRISWR